MTKAMEQRMSATQAALRDLQLALRAYYGEQAPTLLVYGSQARQEADENSDIDVLLLFSGEVQPGREIQQLAAILADLNLRYQVLISILPARKADYLFSMNPFWKNVRREGVPIEAV
jgi:predicted nucleotidyltransferase